MALWELSTLNSGPSQSMESASDLERNGCNDLIQPESSPNPSEVVASCGQLCEANAAYFSWPACRIYDDYEDRENYFRNLQKKVLPARFGQLPTGVQATSLLELMLIRAFHSKQLRRCSQGTAIGFRIKKGVLTKTPAILVFVARKVHERWLNPAHCLPAYLEGPGGVWCDLDVVEFAYFGAPAATPKIRRYTELVDGLGGIDSTIGSGSQVSGQESSGTLGAIVRSISGSRQVGFLTNRHVAVNLDCPSQKMYHPWPPSVGPGIYLGAVERATSFITDENWYGVYAGDNLETFVRADGAFIPFAEDFDMNNVTTHVKGIGEIGNVHVIDLQSPIGSLVGRQVVKLGRSSGLTTGTIMAYSLEYNDEKGICLFTDLLVVGENQQTFDLEGDSGSLILLTSEIGEKPSPVGIIWGGTANRGRLILKHGKEPENWTSGVDLSRLLDLLDLELVTSQERLQDAVQKQEDGTAQADFTAGESSQRHDTVEIINGENAEPYLPTSLPVLHNDNSNQDEMHSVKVEEFQIEKVEFQIESSFEGTPSIEYQFIPFPFHKSSVNQSQQTVMYPENLSVLRGELDNSLDLWLQLGDTEPKKRKQSDSGA